MPYVNVPNDLSKIKTKITFNLTKRQLICFGIGAAVGIPTYLLTRSAIGNTGALFVMLGIMIPAFMMAMYEKDGLPFEKVLRNIKQSIRKEEKRSCRVVNSIIRKIRRRFLRNNINIINLLKVKRL